MKDSILAKGLLAVAAVLLFSANVSAYPGSDFDQLESEVKVSYDDLNLDQTSGAHTLYVRLQRASKEVCGVEGYNIVRSARTMLDMKRCYREALAESVKKIDNDQLTDLHNS